MRLTGIIRTAIAASAVCFGIAPATSATALDLRPLSDNDRSRTQETGCNFSFDVGNRTYLFAIGHDLMVRTAAGLSVCHVGDGAVTSFTDGKRAIICGGRKLMLRRTGRITSNEASDSASSPSTLTVTAGRASHVLRGIAGTAC